jgi:hypothetical protein
MIRVCRLPSAATTCPQVSSIHASPDHPMCALEGPGAPLQLGVALNLWLVLLLPLFIRWAAGS